MFPLSEQISASDIKRGVAQLAGTEAPKFEDNETTFADLLTAFRKLSYLDTFKPEQVDGSEEKITLQMPNNTLSFRNAISPVFCFTNVYFHVTTAYDILRHCGRSWQTRLLGQPNYAISLLC